MFESGLPSGFQKIGIMRILHFLIFLTTLSITTAILSCNEPVQRSDNQSEPLVETFFWFKENLHTHTLWSDGDAVPEVSVDWYRRNGYHFLTLSDHNILLQGERWLKVSKIITPEKLDALRAQFGADWVVLRENDGDFEMRLKTLPELKAHFEVPGKFILIRGEEITDHYKTFPVHVNATNLNTLIMPQGGNSTYEVMQNNIDAVQKQAMETGRSMFAHINHPNFGWGIVAEDLIRLQGDRFFEVYNGHPGVKNWGDDAHPGTDRMWDIVLSMRLKLNRHPVFGIAVDDTHHYHEQRVGKANAGRGWVMVKATALEPELIVQAMERGDFYATTGVLLKNIKMTSDALHIEIQTVSGVTYRTQFIGTPRNFDDSSQPVLNKSGNPAHITRTYSDDIGQIFLETTDNPAIYRFKGDELYIRAKIISDRAHPNPFAKGDVEVAWTQPVGKSVQKFKVQEELKK